MARRPDTPCAVCGKLLYSGKAALPPGERTCRECRREVGGPHRSGWRKPGTTNPYGSDHQRRRKALLPLAFGCPCPVCGYLMLPTQSLDLDHSRPLRSDPTPRPGDRIVHSKCNRGWTRQGAVGQYKERLSTTARGYGAAHQSLRKEWAERVNRGEVCCAKCGQWIAPGAKWHLGHDEQDRTKYIGPLHQGCNCDTGAFRKIARPKQREWSEQW